MPPSGAADATDAERPPGRSVGEVLSEITAVVGDEQEAGRIVAEVLALPLSVVVLRSGEALSPGARERAWTMAEMRAAGVPLQHVLGSWGFRSLDVLVDRRSLVPRPETEQLVELALAQLSPGESAQPDAGGRVVAVDLGTGSGVIALSLAVEGPAGLEVWATERSTDALALARANQERVGAQHREVADGVRFLEGSWFEPLPAELRRGVVLIVSNPPYVSEAEWATLDPVVRDHDPYEALVAGPVGVEAHLTILEQAPQWLAAGGSLVMELAPWQGERLRSEARARGFTEVEVRGDLTGLVRFVVARWPGR